MSESLRSLKAHGLLRVCVMQNAVFASGWQEPRLGCGKRQERNGLSIYSDRKKLKM